MRVNSFWYVLRETAHSLSRNPLIGLASVMTVTISMILLGFSVFFLVNTAHMAKTVESELEIAVFVQNGATAEQVQGLQAEIQDMGGVTSVTLVSKEQALTDFGTTLGGENSSILADLGGTNPFPDALTVKASDAGLVKELAAKITVLPYVDKVRYGQGFVDQLLQFTKWLRWIGIGVVAAFAVASTILISINIKMNVFSRRREIQIMKLVGASNSFVRWPFLIEGIVLGLLGGGLAAVLVGFSYQALSEYISTTLAFLPVVQDATFYWQVIWGIVGVGMSLGFIGSIISVRKWV